MMKRRIFPWMGLIVLFLSFGLGQEILAKEVYTVKRGDTVALIAEKFAVSQEALKEINHLRGNSIKNKQVLTIPATGAKQGTRQSTAKAITASAPLSSYTVKKGDSLYSIAKKTGISVSALKEANHLRSNALKPGRKIMLAKAGPTLEKKVQSAQQSDLDEEDDGLLDEPLAALSPVEAENALASSAELLGKWHNPEEKKLFVKVATAFLGAPYRWGGVSLKGLDCSAFVKKIYELFDVTLPRTAREQAYVGATVAREDMIEGDLVFFNTRRSFGHVGIYIGNNEFVHASSGNRIVRIDNLNESYFNKRFVKAVRLKGLDEVL
ncbi:MAG: NlpC/P60 family protein [Deltaproteobacteria bacterium]|nr:NlpC/P60 family protein [Deltaproteobacteria bacterium]